MPKVYVIDDSLSVCVAVERILDSQGFEVITERSGLNAVVQLQKELPDLVICDAILPDVEGFRICAYIKHHPKLKKTPVMMISGIVDDEVREQVAEVGAECILKKPFAADELIGTVERFVRPSSEDAPPETDPAESSVPKLPEPNKERLRTLFDRLAGLSEFHFVGIANVAGEIVDSARVPGAAQEDLGPISRSMLRQADLLTRRSTHGKLDGVIIEESGGIIFVRPLTDQYVVVLALRDVAVLGKARLVLRRSHRDLVDALYDRKPETVDVPATS